MFEALGLTVSRLIRIRFGKIELPPRLARGKMMELEAAQVKSVLASAGMVVEDTSTASPGGARQDRNNAKRGSRDGKARPEGQLPREGQRARPPREPREPRPARNPRTPPRGSQVSRDFAAGSDAITQLDENGAPILASPGNFEGDINFTGQPNTPREGRRDGQRDGQRNKRRSRGSRGPRAPIGNDAAGNDGRSFASQLGQDSAGAGDNIGNSAQPPQTTDGANALAARPPNADRGRSRRNLRGRTSRGPRSEQATPRTEPKENNGNE